MKKYFFCALSICWALSAEPLVWNAANKFDGWNRAYNAKVQIGEQYLTLTEIKFDCSVRNIKVNIDPLKYDTFTFRYRASGTGKGGQFYFNHKGEQFSDARMWKTPVLIADNEWHTVSVSPKDQRSWQTGGMIISLRFDPVDPAGGTIEFSELRLEKKAAAVPSAYIWNKTSLKDWKSFRNCKGSYDGECLKMQDIVKDCSVLISAIEIDPSRIDTIVYRYRATGITATGGEIFYKHGKEPFTAKYFFPTPALIADGQWHTLEVPIPNLKLWKESGIITGIRLDPTNGAGGMIEISEIKLIGNDQQKKNVKLDAPAWPKVRSELFPPAKVAMPEHYFQGKMIRSPEDKFTGGTQHDFILCKTFSLKEAPVHGWLQFTADDCSEAFINGRSVGHSNDWRKTSVVDVAKYLKAGKNILTFHYLNFCTYGGVIGELYVQYGDGSSERINTDKSFLCGLPSQKNWNTENVDLTGWQAAIEQDAPPAAPWKITLPYHYFYDMQKVTKSTLSHKSITAGETIRINLEGEGKIPEKAFPVIITLSSKSTRLWDETIQVKPDYFSSTGTRRWKASIPYPLPLYISGENLTISLESDQLSCQGANNPDLSFTLQRVQRDPHFPEKTVFKVCNTSGTPHFTLNGKPFYAYWLIPGKDTSVQAEFNVVTVGVHHELLWPMSGTLNLHLLDQKAEEMRRRFPNAYFMWNIRCVVPYTWGDIHPNEMCLDEKGNINRDGWASHSYSSKVALEEFKQVIEATIRHLQASPYANRIMGYRITGGHTTEWLGWDSMTGSAIDFAPCAKKDFAEFVAAKYPALKDGVIPSGAERKQMDGSSLLWDQEKHLKTIAYFDFVSNSTADTVIALCAHARKIAGSDKLIGSYFGYISTLHYTGKSQMRAHYALKKLLDSGAVDFIMSPQSYPLRKLGETCGDMKPFRTLQMHNVISVCEDDTRTHNGVDVMKTSGSEYQTVTEEQSISILRRNMSIAVCRNNPSYHLPMFDEHLNFSSFPAIVKALRRLGQHCLDKNVKRHAEIALVCSEETVKSMPVTSHISAPSGIMEQFYRADGSVYQRERIRPVLNYETFIGNQDRFTRAGAPVDLLLAEDLNENPGDYKLYVFMNCYKVDEAFRAAVKKLQQKKCVLLWLYAPGYICGTKSSTENMTALTGFSFEQMSSPELAQLKMKDGRLMGTPSVKTEPMFAVTNTDADVLGTYPNGKTGAAVMKTGNALSVFSGAWQLDMPFVSKIVSRAGVWRYVDTDDPVEANDSVVTIHARHPGKKQIRFPRKTNVLDVFSQEIIARNVDRIEVDFKLHETRCFYYGDDADTLLSELKK